MLNKLKALRDRLNEKTKLTVYIVAAVTVFIFCALIPLAFRGEIITDGIFDTGERAVVFSKYIAGDSSVKMKVDDKPDKAEIKYCESVFEDLYDLSVADQAVEKTITEGYQFMTLSDGDNSLRLCRMWVQDQGDWTNWLDVYIDVDTGFVYYLYISSICLYNPDRYYSSFDSSFNTKNVADIIAKETGFNLKVLNWSGQNEDTGTAYTAFNGESLIWSINCSVYPSSMVDIKICVA